MTLVQTSVKIELWQLEAAKLIKLNLSHLLRTAIDAALNTNNNLEKEEADIQMQKAIIAAREESLAIKKQRSTAIKSEEIQEYQRKKWLQENPDFLDEYQKNKLGPQGWQILRRELKFSTKKQTEEFLQMALADASHKQQREERLIPV